MEYQNSTEDILGSKLTWKHTDGNEILIKEMETDHLRNVLTFLFKNREKYWFRCEDIQYMNQFDNGDEFFKVAIKRSELWLSISEELEKRQKEKDRTKEQLFNYFDIKISGSTKVSELAKDYNITDLDVIKIFHEWRNN